MRKMLIPGIVILLLVSFAFAQEPAKLTVAKDDTIRAVLVKHEGHRVTVKLASGEELTGIVRSVGTEVLHLGELTGREFFDAVIDHDEIAAVVVRVRS